MKLVTCARWGLALAFLAVVTSLVWAHGNKPWPAPKEAIDRQNPVTATLHSQALGNSLYKKNCLSCHGPTGKGDGPMAAELPVKPSDFTDTHMMGEMSEGEIFWKMSEGRGPMPSFKKLLNEEERWHLVNYLHTFARPHGSDPHDHQSSTPHQHEKEEP